MFLWKSDIKPNGRQFELSSWKATVYYGSELEGTSSNHQPLVHFKLSFYLVTSKKYKSQQQVSICQLICCQADLLQAGLLKQAREIMAEAGPEGMVETKYVLEQFISIGHSWKIDYIYMSYSRGSQTDAVRLGQLTLPPICSSHGQSRLGESNGLTVWWAGRMLLETTIKQLEEGFKIN